MALIYKVLIADDEPPFIRSLKRMLDKYAANFQVVGEAFNGVDALEKVRKLRPDIVFTDIKMPCMDGIELIKNIELKAPETLCVIISGYQDFNYAREAMKTIAVEYLLKPLEPDMLSQVLLNLADKLDDRMFVREQALLQTVADGTGDLSEQDKELFADYDCWLATVFCYAGTQDATEACKKSVEETIRQSKQQGAHCYLINGENKEEQVLFFAWKKGFNGQSAMKDSIARIFELAGENQAFITAAVHRQPVCLDELGDLIMRLRETLRAGIVIGKSRLIEEADEGKGSDARLIDSIVQNNLRYLMQNKQIDDVSIELDRLFADWEKQGYTKAVVKQMLSQLVMLAQEASTVSCSAVRIGRLFELACNESGSYTELKKSIMEIIAMVLENSDESDNREERQRTLIGRMSAYVHLNLSQQISLQTVCNAFSLSQPTVSRLFREYFGVSFVEYLTAMRMNHAKRLMKEQPDMKLRAIAEIVGYADQHYFSRKFKQFTGKSPSDYLTSDEETLT